MVKFVLNLAVKSSVGAAMLDHSVQRVVIGFTYMSKKVRTLAWTTCYNTYIRICLLIWCHIYQIQLAEQKKNTNNIKQRQ